MSDTSDLSRREMIAVTAAALALPLLPSCTPARPAGFLTAAELALLDELTDIVIPTDAKSPGARAAGVAAYIDSRLAETLDADLKTRWRSGLAAVEALAQEMHGKAFLEGTPEQRLAVVTRMAANEEDPKTPAEHFFRDLKRWTTRGYYTSKIGIQLDQEYKGNVVQPGDYAGFDAT